MALQAGMGLSRIFLIVGAGYTGTILMKNGKLSDILGELQNFVKGMEKSGEYEGRSDSEAIAAQVRRLAAEVRNMASSKQITVLHGNTSNLTSLIVPAAALGAVGYAYMWWKGLSFSDMMYVTRHSMTTAVTNLTKHLDHVSDAVAAAKRHLTQRIENLDGKVDDQVEISKLIRTEVSDVRDDISQLGFDLDLMQRMVSGLDLQLVSLERKQEITNAGVMYLCDIVNGKKGQMPEMLQDQIKIVGAAPGLMGLKEIADCFSSGNNLLTDGSMQDGFDKLNNYNKTVMSNY